VLKNPITLVITSCQSLDNINDVPLNQKYIRTVDKQIVSELPRNVYDKIIHDLKKNNQQDDIKELTTAYSKISSEKISLSESNLNTLRHQGAKIATNVTFNYRVLLYKEGWKDWTSLGFVAGTTGQSIQMQGIEFASSLNIPGTFQVRGHIESLGWSGYKGLNELVGTGEYRRLEALQLQVSPSFATYVYYQAHVSDLGWLPLVSNGEIAGTVGQARRMEAFVLYMYILL
jgi:hypothetical protein